MPTSSHHPFRFARILAAAALIALLPLAFAALPARSDPIHRVTTSGKDTDKRQLRAGAATANITPRLGRTIVGGWGQPKAKHVHDELHARCLVLDDGETKLAFVVCDSLKIDREIFDLARRYVLKETGIPMENLMLSATHTHSGPSCNGTNDGDPDYGNFLARRMADGIQRALNNLEPARIGFGVASEPGEVFNRRWKMKPGSDHLRNPFGGIDKARMNPPGNHPDLIEPAGPVDPEISFLTVQATDGRPIALLANYGLHYVGGTRPNEISADYFAMFADRIQQLLKADRLDPPFVGIMSNGTSGDINNIPRQGKPRKSLPPYGRMRHVANVVADKVFAAHQKVRFQDWVPLGAQFKELSLATRKPTPEQLAWAKKVLAQPEDAPQWHARSRTYAQRTFMMDKMPARLEIVVQAFRVGDVGIAAIPFETFAETGLEIKKRSPFQRTFTISLANGGYGYLPTPEQHEMGGYETWLGTSRVETQATVRIVDTLMEQFDRLKESSVAK